METFNVARAERVYVYSEPVRMNKAFRGLTEIVEKKMKKKVLDGDLFMFFNKKRTYVKVIFWAQNGLCIFSKVISGGTYDLEKVEGSEISIREMQSCLNVIQERPTLASVKRLPEKTAA